MSLSLMRAREARKNGSSRRTPMLLLLLLLLSSCCPYCTRAWTPPTSWTKRSTTTKKKIQIRTSSIISMTMTTTEDNMDASSSSSGSSMVPFLTSGKSQLAAAFVALDESDQYDAVLTGLCAKILDTTSSVPLADVTASLTDSAALLTEMNQRQIPASPRSLMALIDASTTKKQQAKS
jgi:hypothetical protein